MIIFNLLFEAISKYPDGTPKINKTTGVLSKVRSMFRLGPKKENPAETQKKLFRPIIADDAAQTSSSAPKPKHL
jgi:hypothetical protein